MRVLLQAPHIPLQLLAAAKQRLLKRQRSKSQQYVAQ
jgi:hypothetical protein